MERTEKIQSVTITAFELEQIEAAASGKISGTLREWPVLLKALKKTGYLADESTTARAAKSMCQHFLGEGSE